MHEPKTCIVFVTVPLSLMMLFLAVNPLATVHWIAAATPSVEAFLWKVLKSSRFDVLDGAVIDVPPMSP